MKNLKIVSFIISVTLLSCFMLTFTSCQEEINDETGTREENTETLTLASQTTNDLKRSVMHDGTNDDFIDGISCTSVVFPYTIIVKGETIEVTSEDDYEVVLEILGRNEDDLVVGNTNDIVFEFPITIITESNTERTIENETIFEDVKRRCENIENSNEESIRCVKFNFPIEVSTFDQETQETGLISFENKRDLFRYIRNLDNNQVFSIIYPITANTKEGNVVEITSNADLRQKLGQCRRIRDEKAEGLEDAIKVKELLAGKNFRIENLRVRDNTINGPITRYTFEFAEDILLKATRTFQGALEEIDGTYTVRKGLSVFVSLRFMSDDPRFVGLSRVWTVVNFNDNSILLRGLKGVNELELSLETE